jgi:hypothetical protein
MKTVFLCALLFATPLFAEQPEPSKRQLELIDELLELTRPEDAARRGIEEMAAKIRPDQEKASQALQQLMLAAVDVKKLTREACIPVYARNFDEQQLAQLVAFFKTPAGKQFAKLLPELEAEAMSATSKALQKALMGGYRAQ